MRKSFVYAAGLMCLALSITDCQKELVDQTTPASEPNFELFAQPVTTKTANNGLDTKWVANDAINVFHAEAGSTAYDSDGRFTVKDIETGRFDGTVSTSLSADKSYDWYAFYPYTSQITTPDNTASGYCYIGSRSDASQTQKGDNNMSHICGSNYPLYGIAKNVNASDVPSIQMQHLTSVIKIVVTNSTEEELSLNSVSFTAEENISGQFYIAFNSETPKYTSAGHPSKTANLTVSDVKVAPKAKATVYMAIKPFTAKTGSTLKLAVNGYEKTLTLKNDITFTAGHIKKLKFDYDKVAEIWTKINAESVLKEGQYVILAQHEKSSGFGYLPNSKNTQSAPKYKSQDVFNGTSEKITASSVIDEMRWNFKQNTDKSWTITNTEGNFLYGIADNNGIRVGATEDKWTITAHSENSMTWSFKNGKSRFLGVYNNSDWRSYTSLTASNFGEKGKNSQVILYYCGSISSLPSLEMPIVAAETRNTNSVYVSWNAIDGAKDYTVTCGTQSITLSGTEHTFTGLAYSTNYTISVVANPADASVNAPSAAGTATATTGANPSVTVTDYTIIFKTATTDGSQTISKSTKASTVISDGVDYVSSFSSNCSKSYYSGKSGVKLGTGSVAGTFEFNLADAVSSNIVSIKVISAKYGSDTGTITFSADGFSLKAGINPGEDYTHSFSTPTNVKTLSFKTSTKRAYISKIVISVSSK